MKVLGLLVLIGSIVLGLYLGVWVCFIGGIVEAIEGAKATPVDAMNIAIGIARLAASGLVGWLTFFVGATLGAGLIATSSH